ncbi:electron transfer flavoprotein-ubiquinone oxidoreductase [Vibrio sp. ZSDE26]|uniref:Electron transfer flavoprotein-ubiquinone oxidoreductase n=1 Tax=Vibrio amylolyticus TaxID=2847292 RepID=A0A9X1XII6_9VIBR|nr:electron transfer flavoprotein-ubiquinone oxidoreductase [Vibrio amylolyticus]MCK6263431.1 electron transfer flavoprotein-ubiquinone oxidoreductase [Vibrio amylolyticus]
MDRECMEFDVVIVGAGPSGLSAACQLALLNKQQISQSKVEKELTICVIEKASELGGHILSGALFETTALDELFPNWQEMNTPLTTKVTSDELTYLTTKHNHITIPHVLTPAPMHNITQNHENTSSNYIVSLSKLCQWLSKQAEELGVEIFPGFAAAEINYDSNGSVTGINTSDMGLDKQGNKKANFEAGIALKGKYTLFAEGARGHLGKQLIKRFKLDEGKQPQHYALGLKEIWQLPSEPSNDKSGQVIHSTGWPLSESKSSGGGFLYHLDNNQISVGLIVDLNYQNPYLSPFEEFQRLKHHPVFKRHLKGAERLSYGARAITKGGLYSLPKQQFPGGLLIGCDAGTLNASKIKGCHCAMKSGMLAADAIFEQLNSEQPLKEANYQEKFYSSWLYDELLQARNFSSGIHKYGAILGGALATLEHNIWPTLFKTKTPWDLQDAIADHQALLPLAQCQPIQYAKPDGIVSFDKLSSVYLSGTQHEENQPCHLILKDPLLPINKNLPDYDEPAQRYCPAGVYEIIQIEGEPKLQINAANCVHCKTCDIKDPCQNITWQPPEGGGGPSYQNM